MVAPIGADTPILNTEDHELRLSYYPGPLKMAYGAIEGGEGRNFAETAFRTCPLSRISVRGVAHT